MIFNYPTIKKSFSKASGVGTVNSSTGNVTFPANTSSSQQQCEVNIDVWCDGYYECKLDTVSEYAVQDGAITVSCIKITDAEASYSQASSGGGYSVLSLNYTAVTEYSNGSTAITSISSSDLKIVATKKRTQDAGNPQSNGDVYYGKNDSAMERNTPVSLEVYHKDYRSCGGKTITPDPMPSQAEGGSTSEDVTIIIRNMTSNSTFTEALSLHFDNGQIESHNIRNLIPNDYDSWTISRRKFGDESPGGTGAFGNYDTFSWFDGVGDTFEVWIYPSRIDAGWA